MLILAQIATYSVIGLSLLFLASFFLGWLQKRQVADKMADADLALFKAETELVLERKREHEKTSELSWNSFRKFELVKKEMEAQDQCSFYLSPHDRRPLPPFKPGQYLTFQLNIPGQKKPVIRCYSLSDSAFNPDHYRLTVKKVHAPRDQDVPPGLSSNYFHDVLEVSDIIEVKAPSGGFFFDLTKPHPSVLIGGGIGLTPVLSMVNSMVDSGYTQETWFFYGVRNGAEHAMKEHLQRLDEEHDWLHLQVCYSAPDDDAVLGDDYQQKGRVSVELMSKILPSNNYDYYMCGPPAMMNTVVADLEEWGVPEKNIHFEAFGPASVKKAKPAEPAAGDGPAEAKASFEVNFAKSGKKFEWDGEADSILEFAEENDIDMEFGCRAGNCGSCMTAVKSGDIELVQEAGADCEKGSCLTCVSIPKSNLVLDA